MEELKNKETDELVAALREGHNHGIAPEMAAPMRQALSDFREKLEDHPYVKAQERRQERWRGWIYLRRGVRYALVGMLLFVGISSMTKAGREMLNEGLAWRYWT